MKKLEEKRQLAVGMLLLVVMVLFYFKVLLGPLAVKLKQVGELRAQYRREVAVTEAGLKRMEQVKNEIQRLEEAVGETQHRFPSEREPILEELSDIAENAGIKIVEMTPGTEVASTRAGGLEFKDLVELPITLHAVGGYHEFGTFVNALENSERIYLVEDLSIRTNPDKERIHSFQVVLKAFLKEEPKKR